MLSWQIYFRTSRYQNNLARNYCWRASYGLPFASASELRKFIPLNFVLIIIITIISVQIFLSFVNILKGTSNVHFPQVNMILYGLHEMSATYFG